MNDEEAIIRKVQKYLEEKEGLELQAAYFLTKKMNEDYWERIQDESGLDDIEDEDDLDLEDPEEETPEEEAKPTEEKPAANHEKGIKTAIKKPKVGIKKKSVAETPEEDL